MLMSLDGKINSGDSDELDVDRDWCKIDGVKKDYINIMILKKQQIGIL